METDKIELLAVHINTQEQTIAVAEHRHSLSP